MRRIAPVPNFSATEAFETTSSVGFFCPPVSAHGHRMTLGRLIHLPKRSLYEEQGDPLLDTVSIEDDERAPPNYVLTASIPGYTPDDEEEACITGGECSKLDHHAWSCETDTNFTSVSQRQGGMARHSRDEQQVDIEDPVLRHLLVSQMRQRNAEQRQTQAAVPHVGSSIDALRIKSRMEAEDHVEAMVAERLKKRMAESSGSHSPPPGYVPTSTPSVTAAPPTHPGWKDNKTPLSSQQRSRWKGVSHVDTTTDSSRKQFEQSVRQKWQLLSAQYRGMAMPDGGLSAVQRRSCSSNHSQVGGRLFVSTSPSRSHIQQPKLESVYRGTTSTPSFDLYEGFVSPLAQLSLNP